MKINDMNRMGGVNPYRKQMTPSQAGQAGKKNRAKDGVQFSEEAMKLLESQGTAATDPARAAKLNELKASVTTGTYKIDAGLVAEKLLPYFKQ